MFSSFHSYFLKFLQTEYYCDFENEIRYHNEKLPNKQNEICNLQSTFDVVMQNVDFQNQEGSGGEWDIAPETEFEILKQNIGKFVLVLDTSSSMSKPNVTRFEQLKQSTMRWIKYDIDLGSQLGIVSFK